MATPKSVPQSLISLKVSLRDLTGEFYSVHPSPLLDFLDGAFLGSPPLFWLGPLLCANTLLCPLSHHCLRTFSCVLCSLHSFFLHEGISPAPFFPNYLYTHLHVSHLSSGPSIQLPVLTSSFYFSRAPQTQHVPHSSSSPTGPGLLLKKWYYSSQKTEIWTSGPLLFQCIPKPCCSHNPYVVPIYFHLHHHHQSNATHISFL